MTRPTFLALLCLLSLGCAPTTPGPQQGLPLVQVELKGKAFSAEVATTLAEQKKGLQHRAELSPDSGMLFVYEQPRELRFWMKDTQLSLDILFFDGQRRFLNAHYGAPPGQQDPCPNYASEGKAGYVLELSAGTGQALGLEKGDALMVRATEP